MLDDARHECITDIYQKTVNVAGQEHAPSSYGYLQASPACFQ